MESDDRLEHIDWPRVHLYCLGQVTIGSRVRISFGSTICSGSHDYKSFNFDLLKLPIDIGDHTWIAAEVFIGPNLRIGSHSVVGARSVCFSDVPSRSVVAGNPSRLISNHQ